MENSDRPGFNPLYAQVKEILIAGIREGNWKPGEALPSEQRLSKQFNVSAGTVRKAIDEMTAERLLYRQQGKGTFVASHEPKQSLYHFFHLKNKEGETLTPESQVHKTERGKASAEERRILNIERGATVWRIFRVRLCHGEKIINERITLSPILIEKLRKFPNPVPNTLYDFYQKESRVFIVNARDNLRAITAEKEDAEYLDLLIGTPLLEVKRVAYDLSGKPVEFRLSKIKTDNAHYHVSLQ